MADDARNEDSRNEMEDWEQQQLNSVPSSIPRRQFLSLPLVTAATTVPFLGFLNEEPAYAGPLVFPGLGKFASSQDDDSSFYVLSPRKNATGALTIRPTSSSSQETSSLSTETGSIELVLLRLLPVRNTLFRQLQSCIEGLYSLRNVDGAVGGELWTKAQQRLEVAVDDLDKKRGQLEPVFNPDDDTALQISKGIRCEKLVETLRSQMVELSEAVVAANSTRLMIIRSQALLGLSDLGELLVSSFPYKVPTQGKYSYLPRLQGRARVTFSFRRGSRYLGNVTILADGFLSPIAAGNFLDLSLRNFYTGLPIKNAKKRLGGSGLGPGPGFEVASLNILGSFQEGFFDPLTAKPRRIPLEIVRVDKTTGAQSLTYARGFSELDNVTFEKAETATSRPVVSFKTTPGLVAMNHPEKNPNGGSSEFFALQKQSVLDGKESLLDGEYAPFGYIIEGYDLFQKLQANDVIDQTIVDEWGQLSLIKIRQSSFSEVVEGSSSKEAVEESGNKTNSS